MKKGSVKWIAGLILLVVLIAGALFLYHKLSQEYKGDNLRQNIADGASSEESEAVPSTVQAPDFTVLDAEGNEVKLSDYIGKPIVLNFWATWCYYCKEEMPDFNTAYEKYPEIQFLMINATDGNRETVDGAKAYIQEQEFDFEVLFDTKREAVSAYCVSSFRTTYFIDKSGALIARGSGMMDLNTLEKGIKMISE